MTRNRTYGPAIVLGTLSVVFAFGAPFALRKFAFAEQAARREAMRAELRNSPMAKLNDLFRNVAHVVEPSVVHIAVTKKAPAGAGAREDLPPFLRERLPNTPPGVQGSGSGWIYEHVGKRYIITNNHVVRGADQITVKFWDKSTRSAQIVGRDPKTDIAVLTVEGDLHPVKIADKSVQRGEIVFAFGSPFQFEFSVSQGIVSGMGRELGILAREQGYENFIQTDAAINPGNSGGPLTNVYGEVVGMNTAIATRTGASNGLAFAIPADMIRNVVRQIIDTGTVTRGYLGVWIRDLDPKLAGSFKFDGKGVLVDDLVGGDESPAKKAGVVPGDIITKVNGRAVASSAELRRTVAAIRPDAKIDIEVFRAGKRMTLSVKLAKLPGNPVRVAQAPPKVEPKVGTPPLEQLGLTKISTLTAEESRRHRLPEIKGVLIQEIKPRSPAAKARLMPGTIITHVMQKRIETVEQLNEQLKGQDVAAGVRLRVRIGDRNRFVFLTTKR